MYRRHPQGNCAMPALPPPALLKAARNTQFWTASFLTGTPISIRA
jgi:hypothetical protein